MLACDYLARMGAIEVISTPTDDDYPLSGDILCKVRTLVNALPYISKSFLRKYYVSYRKPSVINYYSYEYSFVIPTSKSNGYIPSDIVFMSFNSRLSYDSTGNHRDFEEKAIKFYNVLDFMPINKSFCSLYFSIKHPIIILNLSDSTEYEKIKQNIEYVNLKTDYVIDLRPMGNDKYAMVFSDKGEYMKSDIASSLGYVPEEFVDKMSFLQGYIFDNDLGKILEIRTAFDTIGGTIKVHGKELISDDILRKRVMDLLDKLYNLCEQELERTEELKKLACEADLDGIDEYLNSKLNNS